MKNKKTDIEKRKQQLINAIEENPKDLDNHMILAKFYFVNEYYPAAIEIYKKLLEYYPKNTEIMYNLAVAYQADKQFSDAKEMYLKVLKVDPSYKEAQDKLLKLSTFK